MSTQDHGGPVVFRDEFVHIGPGQRALRWSAKKCRRWLIMLLHSPFGLSSVAVAALGVYAWFAVSQLVVYLAVGLALVGGRLWHRRSPAGFNRHVRMRARGLWRGWWIYRRKWGRAMRAATITHIKGSQLPILLGVHSTQWVDEAEFRLLDGQQPGDYIPNAQRLNTTFKGKSVTIERVVDKEDRLRIYTLARDPLAREVPPRPKPTIEDLLPRAGICPAITERGTDYRLKILGQNTFITGYSGAGKSGWLYSIIDCLHPALEHGLARLIGLDPKLNELKLGEHLFYHLVRPKNARDIQGYFHDLWDMFSERKEAVGDVRFLEPSLEYPLMVPVVDEWAAATVWIDDHKIRRDIQNISNLLLSQMRAFAWAMLAALQDPKKESLPQRDLFQNSIGLRMPHGLIDMVMGDDAWLKGAKCDLIPPMLPAIGYVRQAARPDQYDRCRAGFMRDEMILDLDPTKPISIVQAEPAPQFGHLPQWGGFGYN